jgi:hypothetical protein
MRCENTDLFPREPLGPEASKSNCANLVRNRDQPRTGHGSRPPPRRLWTAGFVHIIELKLHWAILRLEHEDDEYAPQLALTSDS